MTSESPLRLSRERKREPPPPSSREAKGADQDVVRLLALVVAVAAQGWSAVHLRREGMEGTPVRTPGEEGPLELVPHSASSDDGGKRADALPPPSSPGALVSCVPCFKQKTEMLVRAGYRCPRCGAVATEPEPSVLTPGYNEFPEGF